MKKKKNNHEDDDKMVLPCGCKMWLEKEQNMFIIQPCQPLCKYFLYAIAETQRLHKPIITINKK